MSKVIIIRYGEIFLKGKNRDFFESLLIKNIKYSLKKYKCDFVKTHGRYFVENYNNDDELDIVDAIKNIFGVYSLSVAYKVETKANEDFVEIRNALKELAIKTQEDSLLKEPKFRVTVRRADKKVPIPSYEIAADLGGVVLDNTNFTVSLKQYDYDFMVDMRENGYSYIYSDIILAVGGLPVGCSAKGMILLSGGIDSPVAAYMMAKRGMPLVAIHFASPPYTSEMAKQKVIDLRNIVEKYTTKMPLYVVPFTEIQLAIHEKCPADYMITIMRRFMMRVATIIAKNNDCKAIITGESLGQVASQTVESMTSTEDTSGLPIFRPLVAFDKEETMALSKKIGTYDKSIEPYEDCCTIFLPKSPAIHPKLEKVREMEKNLDIDELVKNAIDGIELL